MHVFLIEICCRTLGADSCFQSGRSPELVKVAGESGSSLHQGQWPGMSGPRRPLEASKGNEYFVHGVQGRKMDQLLTCNLPFSVGYTGEVFSCLSNPSMLAMQEFGDMSASILQLHHPQGRAGKLLLQRTRVNISSLKAITVSVAHLGSVVVAQSSVINI